MTELIRQINTIVNHFVWGKGMLFIFIFVGIMFTVRTGFFQFTKWKVWFGMTAGQIFSDKKIRKTSDKASISQFQSFCTALAATLGTGNITGVATALIAGGPGAIFWMWISALFGLMTTYAENLLGIKYRYKDENGEWVGGAMVYMERGLKCKWLAVIFALFCLLASFGMGNMTQANSIAAGLKEAFYIKPEITGIVVMIVTALVLFGGIKRIAAVTEKMVPFMAIFYMIAGGIVLAVNFPKLPGVFELIFKEAFQIKAAGGGLLGYGMQQAIRMGLARGVFSNEAGLGSSVMAHAASDVKDAPVQGMWAMLEVFVDTIIVCTMTALVILCSGIYDKQLYLSNIAAGIQNIDGTTLAGAAFSTVIPYGNKFLAASIALFAFCTIIGWEYFGERTFVYLFGVKSAKIYRFIYILILFPGCIFASEAIWEISDTFNGLMAIPNLLALVLLSNVVIKETKEYMSKYKPMKKSSKKSKKNRNNQYNNG